jgi:phenylacetic acid degradation operon negative regulatory protein
MKARTEELLYLLLWSADQLMRPSFRNLTDSFENWAYRNGFLRQLQELEARKLIERKPGDAADALWRLTESGRLAALGGCDPVAEWGRRWDGRWRLVLFDVPQAKAHARASLRRFLKNNRFGYLQNSVWVSPDPLSEITKELSASAEDVESIITLEAQTAAGETNAAIVSGAWNFPRINELYENCLKVLRELPQAKPKNGKASDQLLRWAQWEKSIWQEAASADPFLPDQLLPGNYLGKKAWRERTRVLAQAAQRIG